MNGICIQTLVWPGLGILKNVAYLIRTLPLVFTINNSDTESESNSMMCLQCDQLFDMKTDLEAHRIAHHSEDIYNNEIYGESNGEEIEISYEEFVLDSERTQEPEQIVLQTVPQPPSNISAQCSECQSEEIHPSAGRVSEEYLPLGKDSEYSYLNRIQIHSVPNEASATSSRPRTRGETHACAHPEEWNEIKVKRSGCRKAPRTQPFTPEAREMMANLEKEILIQHGADSVRVMNAKIQKRLPYKLLIGTIKKRRALPESKARVEQLCAHITLNPNSTKFSYAWTELERYYMALLSIEAKLLTKEFGAVYKVMQVEETEVSETDDVNLTAEREVD
ncbi:unnamed protein product [Lepeophtheirus salmonis]|uniref:(salmon louse) hypothetical protein n=1 Tax=Lepeophtheirus salmonis TaxID=72036 RepID=A0A7R8DAU7_LEPSM|nr:unnamed protein product [Lepeophtheirus salmonis]CAF3029042.1 unnamed protein product [Lepeophtheirus salmonis]